MKLFYGSVVGLAGLVGLIFLYAWAQPTYSQTHWITVRVTSPTSWQRVCYKDRAFTVKNVALYYSASEVPMTACQTAERAILTPIARDLEAECPGGSCDEPGGPTEGRLMEAIWEDTLEQQKTAPR